MPRSILTEKLNRRGYHLSREYGVDPLEMVSVEEVMKEQSLQVWTSKEGAAASALPDVLAYSDETCRAVAEERATSGVMTMPAVDRETGMICGTISAQELLVGRRRAVARELERERPFQFELERKL